MVRKEDVRLHQQSFNEFADTYLRGFESTSPKDRSSAGVYIRAASLVGLVATTVPTSPPADHDHMNNHLRKAYSNLKQLAANVGATDVFGVTHQFSNPGSSQSTRGLLLVTGDAYDLPESLIG